MSECKDCTCGDNTTPIVINITFNDMRMDEDASNYVEHLLMEDDCECRETDE
jgi:hypothetical protein